MSLLRRCSTSHLSFVVFCYGIGPFEHELTNTLISETMCLPPSLGQSLSSLIHKKCAGSPNYIVDLLWSLNEEAIIWFSLTTRRWEYRLDSIIDKEVPKEIVEYMKNAND